MNVTSWILENQRAQYLVSTGFILQLLERAVQYAPSSSCCEYWFSGWILLVLVIPPSAVLTSVVKTAGLLIWLCSCDCCLSMLLTTSISYNSSRKELLGPFSHHRIEWLFDSENIHSVGLLGNIFWSIKHNYHIFNEINIAHNFASE